MQRTLMILPRTMGDEKTNTKPMLEEMGFVITDDTSPHCYEALAPDGWTIEWEERNGAVFNKNRKAVIWLWKKSELWQYVFTMRLKP